MPITPEARARLTAQIRNRPDQSTEITLADLHRELVSIRRSAQSLAAIATLALLSSLIAVLFAL